jgi:hypothetical protein
MMMVMNPTVTKMDNWMTILKQMKMGGTRTSGPKTHLKWTNTLQFKDLEKYENLSGPKHSLPVSSREKDFLSYLRPMIFTTKLRKKQINTQLYHEENLGH